MKNIIKNNLAITLIITLALVLGSCSARVYIKSNPSDLVLLGLKQKDDVGVKYELEYNLSEPYIYKHGGGFSYEFVLEKSIKNQYNQFLTTKYPRQGSDYNIKIKVYEFDFKVENRASGLQTANLIFGNNVGMDIAATCSMSVSLDVLKDGKSLGVKNIVANTEKNGVVRTAYDERQLQTDTVEECVGKSLLFVSRQLDTIIK